MKKFHFLIFVTMLLHMISTSSVNASNSSYFKDVPPNHWASEAISWAKNHNIVNGYPDGTFQPNELVTEAEFLAILLNAYKPPSLESYKKVNHWADPYYEFSKKHNYRLMGYDVKRSRDMHVSREQIAELISGADGVNYTSDHAIHYLLGKKYAAGKVPGVITIESFQGKDYLKRAEAVQFIKNIKEKGLKNLKSRPVQPSPLSALPPLTNAGNHPAAPLASESPLTMKQIADLSERVVMIVCLNEQGEEIASGSGFSIGKGLFVTNYHVLEGASRFKLVTNQEKEYDVAGVVRYDQDIDLAIIKTKLPVYVPPVKIGSKEMVEKGDRIFTIGSPYGFINTLSDGLVSSVRKLPMGDQEVDVIQITAPITYGSSGGALFNMYGYVIGVTTFGADTGNLNFAVAIDYTIPWIQELRNTPFNSIETVDLPKIEEENQDLTAVEVSARK